MISNTNNRTLLSMSGMTYDFTFRIDDESELLVYGIDTDGVSTLIETGYSVAFDASEEEGTVTFDSEPTDYDQILMLRSKEYTQDTDIPIRSGFSEEDIENALDHIVMLIQQVKEITDYSVKFDLTSEISGVTLPTPVDGMALAWDGTDGTVQNLAVDTAGLAASVAASEAAQAAAEVAQAAAEAAAASTLPLATVLAAVYPVGSIYSNDAVSTNPATLFGFGTWAAITDRMIIGVGSTFTPVGATGGATTVTLGKGNIPAHTHTVTILSGGSGTGNGGNSNTSTGATGDGTADGLKVSPDAVAIMNPYYAAYIWRRTA